MRRRTIQGASPSWVNLLAAIGFSFFCPGANTLSAQEAFGDAIQGKTVFEAKGCFACHGLAAQGSIATGPALAPSRLSYAAFHAYVRSPAGAMPPYTGGALSDAELQDVFTYLATLPSPRRPADIPLLAAFVRPAAPHPRDADINGRKLFLSNCASCHGEALEGGGAGPALKDESRKRSEAATIAFILSPPPPMPKLSPNPLSEPELRAVVTYIRTIK